MLWITHKIDHHCSRLIDDSFDIQSCNFTKILCCLALKIIKIRKDSNDYIQDNLYKVTLDSFFPRSRKPRSRDACRPMYNVKVKSYGDNEWKK